MRQNVRPALQAGSHSNRLKSKIVGSGRTVLRESVPLYRSAAPGLCGLCGGPILNSELHSRFRLGEGDERRKVPACRACLPFVVVEMLD